MTGDGRRRVVRGQDNLCLIRSGQDWSDTDGGARRMYLDEVEPVLRATHKAIFGQAMKYFSTMGPAARLRLYHEVTVAAADDQHFDYPGCHPGTGLRRALPAAVAG